MIRSTVAPLATLEPAAGTVPGDLADRDRREPLDRVGSSPSWESCGRRPSSDRRSSAGSGSVPCRAWRARRRPRGWRSPAVSGSPRRAAARGAAAPARRSAQRLWRSTRWARSARRARSALAAGSAARNTATGVPSRRRSRPPAESAVRSCPAGSSGRARPCLAPAKRPAAPGRPPGRVADDARDGHLRPSRCTPAASPRALLRLRPRGRDSGRRCCRRACSRRPPTRLRGDRESGLGEQFAAPRTCSAGP